RPARPLLTDLAMAVPAALARHRGVQGVELVGSRARGEETPLSDWDFAVATDGFLAVATVLPALVEPLKPIAQQWDRLGDYHCYMLTLGGPVKVDLIFDEPHEDEPPWEPRPDTLPGIDRHFWDWTLWLASKL